MNGFYPPIREILLVPHTILSRIAWMNGFYPPIREILLVPHTILSRIAWMNGFSSSHPSTIRSFLQSAVVFSKTQA